MKKIRIILMILTALVAAGMWGTVFILQTGADEPTYGEVTVVETPDRTESTEHPLFIVEEYEPVVPAGTNIINMAKIEANAFNDVYTPRKVKDGDAGGTSYWEGAPDSYPNILTATFEEEHCFHAFKLLLNPQTVWGARKQTFSVEVSYDGENFEGFIASAEYDFDPKTNNEVVIEFDETSFRAVRFVFTANTGASGAQLAELELYSNDEIVEDAINV